MIGKQATKVTQAQFCLSLQNQFYHGVILYPCIIFTRFTRQKRGESGLKIDGATRYLILNQSIPKLLHGVLHLMNQDFLRSHYFYSEKGSFFCIRSCPYLIACCRHEDGQYSVAVWPGFHHINSNIKKTIKDQIINQSRHWYITGKQCQKQCNR